MEKIDAVERCVGQALDHVQRIAHVQADILQRAVANMVERADHAVEKGLAADKAGAGPHRRLAREMLAGAEADLHLKRAVFTEQGHRVDRHALGHADPGQQFLDERSLAEAQLVSLAAAIEAADGGRIVHRRAAIVAWRFGASLQRKRRGPVWSRAASFQRSPGWLRRELP